MIIVHDFGHYVHEEALRLLASLSSTNICYSSLETKVMSANLRRLRHSGSILFHFINQPSRRKACSWQGVNNNLGELVSPCLTPLFSGKGSEFFWRPMNEAAIGAR